MKKPKSLPAFVDGLQQKGRYTFTKREAQKAFTVSDAVLKLSLWRLAKKRRIAMIRQGFYVIVPLEYSAKGCLPPEWFIDDLMSFIGQPYYVGLLSAAAIHGAAHQQPQEFHVMTPTAARTIEIGGLRIKFFKKADLKASPVESVKTPTGFIRVSNPAVTAIDLARYAQRIGGLDRVLTVLQELQEKITPEMLLKAAPAEKQLSPVQRLGWLLEKAGNGEMVDKLAKWIHKRQPRETPLDPAAPRKGYSRDSRWKVILNAEVEGEL
jgi:predicted transcriptional regulator of viral defense system